MERHPIDPTSYRIFFKKKLKRPLIPAEEWPPYSPDVNPLDYFYWNFFEINVYKERSEKPFASEAELKNKVKSPWNISTDDMVAIRKAIKTICPTNESRCRKTSKIHQNAVWLMLLHKNSSLYAFFSLCKKNHSKL